MGKYTKTLRLACFLTAESVLYILLLFSGGQTAVISSYSSIVFCFLAALVWGRKQEPLITAGLAFTVIADFCLVICSPIQQLWGMVFFLGGTKPVCDTTPSVAKERRAVAAAAGFDRHR